MDAVGRTLRARIAASERWAHEPDRAAATAPARAGLIAKFERQVDPDGLLSPGERTERTESARRAHYARMALARRRKPASAAAAP
jgi:hypothetical protein